MKSLFRNKTFSSAFFFALPFLIAVIILPFLGEPGYADPKTAEGFALWVSFFGSLHPLFLHLPIGAFILVTMMEVLGLVSFGKYKANTVFPLVFAIGSAFLALVFGYCLYLTGSYSGELIEQHKNEAIIFTALLIITFLIKVASQQFAAKEKMLNVLYLLTLFATGGVMTAAGHRGGQITHGDPIEKLPAAVLAKRAAASEAMSGDPLVYANIVHPILDSQCVYCHGPEKQEGNYRMDSLAALFKKGENETGLIPGDLENSGIIKRVHLPKNDEHHMPPTPAQLTHDEIALLEWWISHGASDEVKVSELEKNGEVVHALANLVSPAERKAKDAARLLEEQEHRRKLMAEKEELAPALAAFNERFPEALNYISSGSSDLKFNAISYVSSFTKEELSLLEPFTNQLHEVNFSLSTIQDEDVATLIQFKELRRLNLSQTKIGDAFIEGLAQLKHLESINLFGTKITAASIPHFLNMPSIKTLLLSETGLSAAETKSLRQQLADNNKGYVKVIGLDEKPSLESLSPSGQFLLALKSQPEKYGKLITGQAKVTLSSNELRYLPQNGLAQFVQDKAGDINYAFHSYFEVRPWLQLSYEQPQQINAFVLKNRPGLENRADGLVLQAQRKDGSWETIWKADAPLGEWAQDLGKEDVAKRTSKTFRFMIDNDTAAILHLKHLALYGTPADTPAAEPLTVADTLAQTGSGELTYVAEPGWGILPGQKHIGYTHGDVAVDQAGNVYVSTDGPNGIIVYRKDGTYLKSIAKGEGKFHGLTLNVEHGQEFLYAAGNNLLVKYTLRGKHEMVIDGSKQPEGKTWRKGTSAAVASNGDIFLADGYASQIIFKYTREGKFIKKFGAPGLGDGQFRVSHGLVIDSRDPAKPTLVVCDRENGRLQLFDLEGNFREVAITELRQPCAASIWKDYLLVAELGGRAVILDKEYKVVSSLGDNPNVAQRSNPGVHDHELGKGHFAAPHGCSFDQDGNIYIEDWSKLGRITKLHLTRNLTQQDLASFAEKQAIIAARAARPEGEDFSPKSLAGLKLWLDAADEKSVNAADGKVVQWDDKSGSNFHAYAPQPKEQPVTGDLKVNGRNALKFYQSRLISKTPANGNWQDMYLVADWNGAPAFDNYNGLFTGLGGDIGVIGNSNGDRKGFYVSEKWWNHLFLNGSPSNGSGVMPLVSQPFMVSIAADEKTDVTGFTIGYDRGFIHATNSRDWEGAVCEIIGFERKLTDAERTKVEGYLAHKWGLIQRLPADHPYKILAP